jgi:uncharacterized protein YrrD
MLSSVRKLIGMTVQATDGAIGDIHDIYFDDHTWSLRYYVVDTGKWLPGRKVLIPPNEVRVKTAEDEGLPLRLSREEVRNSPDKDTDRTVSQQAERGLDRHISPMPFWIPLAPATPVAIEGDPAEREREVVAGYTGGNPHLRSAKEVFGYTIAATDDDIGHIDDFLTDESGTSLKYVVVDTRNWLPGRSVVIPTSWVRAITWAEDRVSVGISRKMVENSPEYDFAIPLDSTYELQIMTHYGQPS